LVRGPPLHHAASAPNRNSRPTKSTGNDRKNRNGRDRIFVESGAVIGLELAQLTCAVHKWRQLFEVSRTCLSKRPQPFLPVFGHPKYIAPPADLTQSPRRRWLQRQRYVKPRRKCPAQWWRASPGRDATGAPASGRPLAKQRRRLVALSRLVTCDPPHKCHAVCEPHSYCARGRRIGAPRLVGQDWRHQRCRV
jgi:hypothetical protein